MNFFLREDHARDLADRLAPLGLRWWCEARVDMMSQIFGRDSDRVAARRLYHDLLRRGVGIRLGVEGNEEGHYDRADAAGCGANATISESFRSSPSWWAIPTAPERDTQETLQFIRQIKRLDPRRGNHHLSLHACPTAWDHVWRD